LRRCTPELIGVLRGLGKEDFSVARAGEEASLNWFNIAREYSERSLHQQQIREAVGAPGLTGRE
jgi:hypothetical protein